MDQDDLVRDALPVNQPYDGLVAEAYDVWLPPDGSYDDRDLFRDLIRAGDGPALELGCGNGRLLVGYLADGLDVEGVDSAADMLAICRASRRARRADRRDAPPRRLGHARPRPRVRHALQPGRFVRARSTTRTTRGARSPRGVRHALPRRAPRHLHGRRRAASRPAASAPVAVAGAAQRDPRRRTASRSWSTRRSGSIGRPRSSTAQPPRGLGRRRHVAHDLHAAAPAPLVDPGAAHRGGAGRGLHLGQVRRYGPGLPALRPHRLTGRP